jgi:16S rRNA (cytidine1402-2'-O)-methyltransferase
VGTLYLVATPIGNLEDITRRALRILAQVSLIAAEDTRQAHKLLQAYQLSTPAISYHEHNKLSRLDDVLAALAVGDVALVSDAGTPALNDPGYELVRAALQAGYPVSPIPGASAPIAALVSSGLPTDAFLYLGYLPRKRSERRALLEEIQDQPYTLIFLEAPHRMLESLQDLQTGLGNRQIAVGRELTKLHEEIFRGSLEEALAHFTQNSPRGEFTLVIEGQRAAPEPWTEARLRAALAESLKRQEPASQIARRISSQSGWPRRQIYRLIANPDELPEQEILKRPGEPKQ